MLAHNLRRWPNSKPALVQRRVFAGLRSTQLTQNIIVLCPLWSVLKIYETTSKRLPVQMNRIIPHKIC